MSESLKLNPARAGQTSLGSRWQGFVLLALIVAAFHPLIAGQFVEWDDYETIGRNPALNPPTFDSFLSYWLKPYMSLYFPLTQSVWHLLAALVYTDTPLPSGLHLPAAPFKILNLSTHALSTLLAYRILQRLSLPPIPALLGAAIFAVHPLQVESVGWTSGFKDLLCALLVLTAIDRYISFRLSQSLTPDRHAHRLWLLSITFALLALLAKPTAVVVPVILLALDRFHFARSLRESLLRVWPHLLLAAIVALATKFFIQTAAQVTTQVDFVYRPLIATDALSFYITRFFWPVDLAFAYGHTPQRVLQSGSLYYTWLLPALLAILLLLARRWDRRFVLAGLLALIPLLPVLGLITFEYQQYSTTGDHYAYMSFLGAAFALATLLHRVPRSLHAPAIALASIFITMLSIQSYRQTFVWRDGESLSLRTVAVDPQSWAGFNNLSAYYLSQKRFTDAEHAASASLSIRPFEDGNLEAQFNIASILIQQGQIREGIPLLARIVRAAPNDVRYRIALAVAYGDVGRLTESRQQLQAALHFDPENSQAQDLLNRLNTFEQSQPNKSPVTQPSSPTAPTSSTP